MDLEKGHKKLIHAQPAARLLQILTAVQVAKGVEIAQLSR